jgi:hypothetical protein
MHENRASKVTELILESQRSPDSGVKPPNSGLFDFLRARRDVVWVNAPNICPAWTRHPGMTSNTFDVEAIHGCEVPFPLETNTSRVARWLDSLSGVHRILEVSECAVFKSQWEHNGNIQERRGERRNEASSVHCQSRENFEVAQNPDRARDGL